MMIYCILFFHYVGDFYHQSRWVADNKSKSWCALSLHVAIYMFTMFFGFMLAYEFPFKQKELFNSISAFCLINAGLHFVQDAITSRLTSYYYSKQDWKSFFNTIGIDQFMHACALLVTAKYILGLSL